MAILHVSFWHILISGYHRYVKPHALLELHTQKNTTEVSHAFLNICEYIFVTTFFSKNIYILCWNLITSKNVFPFKDATWYSTTMPLQLHVSI